MKSMYFRTLTGELVYPPEAGETVALVAARSIHAARVAVAVVPVTTTPL